jgi:hypothetical protein
LLRFSVSYCVLKKKMQPTRETRETVNYPCNQREIPIFISVYRLYLVLEFFLKLLYLDVFLSIFNDFYQYLMTFSNI